MPAAVDVSQDYKVIDNRKTVSLTSASGSTVTGKTAMKETVSQTRTTQGNLVTTVIKCRWHMFKADLSTTLPQEHGYITDDDNIKHYIDQGGVNAATFDERYEIMTTAQATAALTVP